MGPENANAKYMLHSVSVFCLTDFVSALPIAFHSVSLRAGFPDLLALGPNLDLKTRKVEFKLQLQLYLALDI